MTALTDVTEVLVILIYLGHQTKTKHKQNKKHKTKLETTNVTIRPNRKPKKLPQFSFSLS